jgi:DNA-binding LacI/PurR family transcriptional regulator
LSIDQYAGARLATKHLIDLGHRRIAHIAGPQGWIEAELRMDGFLAALADAGLPSSAPLLGDWTAQSGYRAGLQLAEDGEATAIFCGNDQIALGVIHAAWELGLQVPRDISVVGFDDVPESAHFCPPLTTVRQDMSEVAERCIDMMEDWNERDIRVAETITPELVVRRSASAPAF